MRTHGVLPRHGGVFTLADLDDWPESTLIELHEGCIVVNPPPSGRHFTAVNRTIDWLVRAGLEPATIGQNLGIAFESELSDGFVPDVVVVRRVPDPNLSWHPPSTVRIVVEVLSPSTSRRDLGHKRDVYLAAGLTCVTVDPVGEVIVDVSGPDDWIAATPF